VLVDVVRRIDANNGTLQALKGAVVGIDAAHYINQHLVNQSTREALLGALGDAKVAESLQFLLDISPQGERESA
jgi:hypothetical protein